MKLDPYVPLLESGQSVELRPQGASMTPLIRSGQLVHLEPTQRDDLKVNDIVLARVKGRLYLHKISALTHDGRVQISNNHGQVNGWTTVERVYGVCTRVSW